MKKQLLLVLISTALVCTGAFASGSQEMKPKADDTMMKSDDSMKKSDDTMMKSDDTMMKADDSMMKSDAMMKDGVFKKDGKVMVTMGGKTTDLMKDVMLKDGTKIMADGTVVMKNGSKAMLKNGEMYDMDGMKSMVDTGTAK